MSRYLERLAEITDADAQMELVKPLASELLDDLDARTPAIAEAILHMYERNPEADGFGTFSTLNMVLEEVDEAVLLPLLQASLARKPTWPVEELWELYADDE